MNNDHVYVVPNNKKFNNTQTISYRNNKIINKYNDPLKQINEIFRKENFIYRAKVKITTNNGIFTETIIGRNSLNLITINNELIPIANVINIEKI